MVKTNENEKHKKTLTWRKKIIEQRDIAENRRGSRKYNPNEKVER
jgi:hypothetical protein